VVGRLGDRDGLWLDLHPDELGSVEPDDKAALGGDGLFDRTSRERWPSARPASR